MLMSVDECFNVDKAKNNKNFLSSLQLSWWYISFKQSEEAKEHLKADVEKILQQYGIFGDIGGVIDSAVGIAGVAGILGKRGLPEEAVNHMVSSFTNYEYFWKWSLFNLI